MVIKGYPVDIRHIFRQLWWQYRFIREVKATPEGAKLTLLYFSYQPDFPYLALSIKTLMQSAPRERVRQIVVAEDQKAPFSACDISKLKDLTSPIELNIYPIYNFSWGSPDSTHAEIKLFEQVAGRLENPADMIVKCDSDVLFLPNCAKWEQLLDAPQDAFGDSHFLKYRYAQGGLYFLRKRLIDAIFPGTSIQDVRRIATEINSVGEDMAITEICKRNGRAMFFTRTMLFPSEYRQLKMLNYYCKKEFMALHCHKDKDNMNNIADRFITGAA